MASEADHDTSFGVWFWRGSGKWVTFTYETNTELEHLYAEYVASAGSDDNISANSPPTVQYIGLAGSHWIYKVNFRRMTQTNVVTHRERQLRRLSFRSPRWFLEYWNRCFVLLSEDIAAPIEAAYQAGTDRVVDSQLPCLFDLSVFRASETGSTVPSDDLAAVMRMSQDGIVAPEIPQPYKPQYRVVDFDRTATQNRIAVSEIVMTREHHEALRDEICAFCLDALSPATLESHRTTTTAATQSSAFVTPPGQNAASLASDQDVSPHSICQLKCGHQFHTLCFEGYRRNTPGVLKCPLCARPALLEPGPSPSGSMRIVTYRDPPGIPGYEGHDIIRITYSMLGGIQERCHPCPEIPYEGTTRIAYLPDTTEGRHVLGLLIQAFQRGLTFTIGYSVTRDVDNVIVWAGIHHKTCIRGGMLIFSDSNTCVTESFGYPDSDYLNRVQRELAERGVR